MCLHYSVLLVFVYVYVCLSETPVTILKKLEDLRFPEASAVTMECELSRHNVEVKWTKVTFNFLPVGVIGYCSLTITVFILYTGL